MLLAERNLERRKRRQRCVRAEKSETGMIRPGCPRGEAAYKPPVSLARAPRLPALQARNFCPSQAVPAARGSASCCACPHGPHTLSWCHVVLDAHRCDAERCVSSQSCSSLAIATPQCGEDSSLNAILATLAEGWPLSVPAAAHAPPPPPNALHLPSLAARRPSRTAKRVPTLC
jgi:hypothetical protein